MDVLSSSDEDEKDIVCLRKDAKSAVPGFTKQDWNRRPVSSGAIARARMMEMVGQ